MHRTVSVESHPNLQVTRAKTHSVFGRVALVANIQIAGIINRSQLPYGLQGCLVDRHNRKCARFCPAFCGENKIAQRGLDIPTLSSWDILPKLGLGTISLILLNDRSRFCTARTNIQNQT